MRDERMKRLAAECAGHVAAELNAECDEPTTQWIAEVIASALAAERERAEARAAALRAALKDAIQLLGRWTDGSRAVLLDRESELSRFNELVPRARAALATYEEAAYQEDV